MKRKKISYEPGTWFAVPLPSGGYGTGMVARANGRGGVFGYFFGPRRVDVISLSETGRLSPADAVLMRHFGDLGLIRGEWPIIGINSTWERDRWPMPAFWHRDSLSGKMSLRYYDEERLGVFVREEPCDSSAARSAPEDGLSGQGALEVRLDQLLKSSE